MIQFNSLYEIVIDVATRIKPDIDCDIFFANRMKRRKKGLTVFPENKSRTKIFIKHGLEILAHELAHVICPEDDKHGDNWERTFSVIQQNYNTIVMEMEEHAN